MTKTLEKTLKSCEGRYNLILEKIKNKFFEKLNLIFGEKWRRNISQLTFSIIINCLMLINY